MKIGYQLEVATMTFFYVLSLLSSFKHRQVTPTPHSGPLTDDGDDGTVPKPVATRACSPLAHEMSR